MSRPCKSNDLHHYDCISSHSLCTVRIELIPFLARRVQCARAPLNWICKSSARVPSLPSPCAAAARACVVILVAVRLEGLDATATATCTFDTLFHGTFLKLRLRVERRAQNPHSSCTLPKLTRAAQVTDVFANPFKKLLSVRRTQTKKNRFPVPYEV